MATAMRRLWVLALSLAIAASAAAAEPAKVKGFWLPAKPDLWERVPASGVRMKNREGVIRHIPGDVVKNVVTVKADIERVSGVRAELGFVDTETPVAGAQLYDGRAIVVVSLVWLEHLGRDRDAIAALLGHELAHHHLGHTKVGNGGGLAGLLQVLGDAFSRDEELEADEQGLRWAVAAGYDPCGRVSILKMYQRFHEAAGTQFSKDHPATAERARLANAQALSARGRACD